MFRRRASEVLTNEEYAADGRFPTTSYDTLVNILR
jgi:hypothetical protein